MTMEQNREPEELYHILLMLTESMALEAKAASGAPRQYYPTQ